jgi:hypothetical protein
MQYVKASWLDAADSTGPTDPEQVQGAVRYGLHFTTTGSPSSVEVVLQGSLNGSDWFTLVSVTSATVIKWSDSGFNPTQNSDQSSWTKGPVTFIRLNLTSLSGGSSPTVTASVIATDA